MARPFRLMVVEEEGEIEETTAGWKDYKHFANLTQTI